ncbi:MAG: LysR family transcriptional regulator [Janthinobacterium lividum]
MFEFRLKVFYTVAKRLNFTKAAAELFITQPTVTKHINEFEAYFKTTLFERSGNKKIVLTAAGRLKLSDLQVEMQLGSTESIKSHLLHSNCLAFYPFIPF